MTGQELIEREKGISIHEEERERCDMGLNIHHEGRREPRWEWSRKGTWGQGRKPGMAV